MMKQPADNSNARPEEAVQARERVSPIALDSPVVREEIARLAREYFQGRGGIGNTPEEEDWHRAETFVRNLIQATRTA